MPFPLTYLAPFIYIAAQQKLSLIVAQQRALQQYYAATQIEFQIDVAIASGALPVSIG